MKFHDKLFFVLLVILCLMPILINKESLDTSHLRYEQRVKEKNIEQAADYCIQLADRDKKAITIEVIKNIHKRLLQFTKNDAYAGKYRNRRLRIRGQSVRFSEFRDIPWQMDAFIEWLHAVKGDPLTIAVKAHIHLIKIHPFVDGNGRTSRLLMNLLLMQSGMQPALIRNDERLEYLRLMRLYDHTALEDFGPPDLYDFIKQAIERES